MQGPGFPQDKASLVWQGQTLLERAGRLLYAVCDAHSILCGTKERCTRLGVEASGIPDRLAGLGPLGGLEAALLDAEKHDASWALIVPVDLPYLTPAFLMAFVSRALALQTSACCLQEQGVAQPLPALVRVEALPLLQQRLSAGERKILPTLISIAQRLGPERGFAAIEASDLQDAESDGGWFRNLNTPEDLLLLKQSETSETRLHQNTHGK